MSQKISKSHMPTTIYKHRIYTKTIHYLYHFTLFGLVAGTRRQSGMKTRSMTSEQNAMDDDLSDWKNTQQLRRTYTQIL